MGEQLASVLNRTFVLEKGGSKTAGRGVNLDGDGFASVIKGVDFFVWLAGSPPGLLGPRLLGFSLRFTNSLPMMFLMTKIAIAVISRAERTLG